jgi:hypothetical protein
MLMAIVVVNEMAEMNQDIYDQVSSRALPGGELPEGCQLHVAGPKGGGWRVITVWDSEDQFNAFRNDTLIPAVTEVAGEGAVAPNIDTNEAYRVVIA